MNHRETAIKTLKNGLVNFITTYKLHIIRKYNQLFYMTLSYINLETDSSNKLDKYKTKDTTKIKIMKKYGINPLLIVTFYFNTKLNLINL